MLSKQILDREAQTPDGWSSLKQGIMDMKKALLATVALVALSTAANAVDLTCGAPQIYIGHQSKDAKDTVMSVNVQYDQSGWQVHHRMGNGLVAQREYQYMIQDTSNQNLKQWRGYNQKNPQMYMVGEIQRVTQTGAPFYHEWLYVNGALTMESGTYCTEQSAAALTPMAPVQPRVPDRSHDSVPIMPFANGQGVSIAVGVGKYTITMMLDTGASSMSLSKDVANVLVRDGSAYSIGTRTFRMADGRVVEEPMIVVNEVRIGNHILHNVEASVGGNAMLLGFPVVNQIGPFTINTRTNELVFGS
jgi:predicted aspartyl protease